MTRTVRLDPKSLIAAKASGTTPLDTSRLGTPEVTDSAVRARSTMAGWSWKSRSTLTTRLTMSSLVTEDAWAGLTARNTSRPTALSWEVMVRRQTQKRKKTKTKSMSFHSWGRLRHIRGWSCARAAA